MAGSHLIADKTLVLCKKKRLDISNVVVYGTDGYTAPNSACVRQMYTIVCSSNNE